MKRWQPEAARYSRFAWRSAGVALAAAGLAAAGCHRPTPVAMPTPDVEVTDVVQIDTPVDHDWIATLTGLVHAHVHPQVTGYLLARCYSEGSLVKKGDLMFEIDPRPFQAALDQTLAKVGKDEMDVNRLRPLAKEKAVSQEEFDNAWQAYLGDKAAAEQARVNMEFTKVASPLDGLSGLAQAEVGDLVGPNTVELTTVSTIDPIKAYFTVSEQEYLGLMRDRLDPAARARPGSETAFELVLADGNVYGEKGRLYAADNQMDPRTGALRVAAVFPNPRGTLLPGQFARVRFREIRGGARIVPQRAVMELQGNRQVIVVGSDNVAHVRAVRMGARSGPMWIVEDGLQPGERVVVEGVQKAREGLGVAPRPYAPPAAPMTNAPPAAGAGPR
jgi:RND family efflux transporter MFP subunit